MTDQYSHGKMKMYGCDREAGRSYHTPSTPGLGGGTAAQARIRSEQTRMVTKPKSEYHASQFPDSKARRRSVG